jgi:hypothetical protein
VRDRKRVKLHKEKTEEEVASKVQLEEEVSPEEDEEEEEEEEESSISSTSKPVTDTKVTKASLKPYGSCHINCITFQSQHFS